MFTSQRALINHLKESGYNFKTVKAYAGEVGENNAVKLNDFLPAAFVVFLKGNPTGNDYQKFDILIVTESASFDKELSAANNLELCEDAGFYLDENASFRFEEYDYLIDRDTLEAERIFQDNRFTIVAIHLQIKRL